MYGNTCECVQAHQYQHGPDYHEIHEMVDALLVAFRRLYNYQSSMKLATFLQLCCHSQWIKSLTHVQTSPSHHGKVVSRVTDFH